MINGVTDVSRVFREFGSDQRYSWNRNVKIKGKSGVIHTLDLVVSSKEDENFKIAALVGKSDDLAEDIKKFNLVAEDCGIKLKALVIDRDLEPTEAELTRMLNIVTVDKRNGYIKQGVVKVNLEQYSDRISEALQIDLGKYQILYNVDETGISGAKHNIDIMLYSKENNDKIALLVLDKKDFVNEVMLFNSKTLDLGITRKGILVDRDIDSKERRLLEIYNIRVIDIRKRDSGRHIGPGSVFGIDEVDRKFGSSLKKGSVYMISGKTGVGKTTMSLHFLVTGARKGEKGAIILTDTHPTEFISNSSSFNMGFAEHYKKGMIEVFELSDRIREMKYEIMSNGKIGVKFINDMTSEIRKLIVEDNIKRLVIDPITPALVGEDDFINVMFNGLAIPDVITLITSNVRANEFSFYGIEEYYCSGVVKLEFADPFFDVRTMTVLKLRGSSYDTTPLKYRITKDGITPIGIGDDQRTSTSSSILTPFKDGE
ncbi:MAG: ATPase domain-containing protein [Thermoplasmatales archaeon]